MEFWWGGVGGRHGEILPILLVLNLVLFRHPEYQCYGWTTKFDPSSGFFPLPGYQAVFVVETLNSQRVIRWVSVLLQNNEDCDQ